MGDRQRRSIDIVSLPPSMLERLTGERVNYPVIAYAGIISRRQRRRRKRAPRLIAIGGLCWRMRNEGQTRPRCDIFLDLHDPQAVNSMSLVRWARRMLRTAAQLGEPAVYCLRDDIPGSAKLLRLAGLVPVGIVPLYHVDGTVGSGEQWHATF